MTSDINSQIAKSKSALKRTRKEFKNASKTRDLKTADRVLAEIRDLQSVVDTLLASTDDTNATWKSLEEIRALNESLASDEQLVYSWIEEVRAEDKQCAVAGRANALSGALDGSFMQIAAMKRKAFNIGGVEVGVGDYVKLVSGLGGIPAGEEGIIVDMLDQDAIQVKFYGNATMYFEQLRADELLKLGSKKHSDLDRQTGIDNVKEYELDAEVVSSPMISPFKPGDRVKVKSVGTEGIVSVTLPDSSIVATDAGPLWFYNSELEKIGKRKQSQLQVGDVVEFAPTDFYDFNSIIDIDPKPGQEGVVSFIEFGNIYVDFGGAGEYGPYGESDLKKVGRKQAATVEELNKYDHVKIETEVNQGKWALVGQYRGRIVSTTDASFNPQGEAIWVTTDQGFEAMIAIRDIVSLTILEKYKQGSRKQAAELPRDSDGQLSEFAWPGGYPIYYVAADGGVLCPDCARDAEDEGLTSDTSDPQWNLVAADVNYEDDSMYCDHCGQQIPSAYGDPNSTASRKHALYEAGQKVERTTDGVKGVVQSRQQGDQVAVKFEEGIEYVNVKDLKVTGGRKHGEDEYGSDATFFGQDMYLLYTERPDGSWERYTDEIFYNSTSAFRAAEGYNLESGKYLSPVQVCKEQEFIDHARKMGSRKQSRKQAYDPREWYADTEAKDDGTFGRDIPVKYCPICGAEAEYTGQSGITDTWLCPNCAMSPEAFYHKCSYCDNAASYETDRKMGGQGETKKVYACSDHQIKLESYGWKSLAEVNPDDFGLSVGEEVIVGVGYEGVRQWNDGLQNTPYNPPGAKATIVNMEGQDRITVLMPDGTERVFDWNQLMKPKAWEKFQSEGKRKQALQVGDRVTGLSGSSGVIVEEDIAETSAQPDLYLVQFDVSTDEEDFEWCRAQDLTKISKRKQSCKEYDDGYALGKEWGSSALPVAASDYSEAIEEFNNAMEYTPGLAPEGDKDTMEAYVAGFCDAIMGKPSRTVARSRRTGTKSRKKASIEIIRPSERVDGAMGRFTRPAIGRCRYCGAEVTLSHPLDNECDCGACYNMSGQEVIPSWKCDEQGEPYDNEIDHWGRRGKRAKQVGRKKVASGFEPGLTEEDLYFEQGRQQGKIDAELRRSYSPDAGKTPGLSGFRAIQSFNEGYELGWSEYLDHPDHYNGQVVASRVKKSYATDQRLDVDPVFTAGYDEGFSSGESARDEGHHDIAENVVSNYAEAADPVWREGFIAGWDDGGGGFPEADEDVDCFFGDYASKKKLFGFFQVGDEVVVVLDGDLINADSLGLQKERAHVGQVGVVVKGSDSEMSGMSFYDVRFDDGFTGCYGPVELEKVASKKGYYLGWFDKGDVIQDQNGNWGYVTDGTAGGGNGQSVIVRFESGYRTVYLGDEQLSVRDPYDCPDDVWQKIAPASVKNAKQAYIEDLDATLYDEGDRVRIIRYPVVVEGVTHEVGQEGTVFYPFEDYRLGVKFDDGSVIVLPWAGIDLYVEPVDVSQNRSHKVCKQAFQAGDRVELLRKPGGDLDLSNVSIGRKQAEFDPWDLDKGARVSFILGYEWGGGQHNGTIVRFKSDEGGDWAVVKRDGDGQRFEIDIDALGEPTDLKQGSCKRGSYLMTIEQVVEYLNNAVIYKTTRIRLSEMGNSTSLYIDNNSWSDTFIVDGSVENVFQALDEAGYADLCVIPSWGARKLSGYRPGEEEYQQAYNEGAEYARQYSLAYKSDYASVDDSYNEGGRALDADWLAANGGEDYLNAWAEGHWSVVSGELGESEQPEQPADNDDFDGSPDDDGGSGGGKPEKKETAKRRWFGRRKKTASVQGIKQAGGYRFVNQISSNFEAVPYGTVVQIERKNNYGPSTAIWFGLVDPSMVPGGGEEKCQYVLYEEDGEEGYIPISSIEWVGWGGQVQVEGNRKYSYTDASLEEFLYAIGNAIVYLSDRIVLRESVNGGTLAHVQFANFSRDYSLEEDIEQVFVALDEAGMADITRVPGWDKLSSSRKFAVGIGSTVEWREDGRDMSGTVLGGVGYYTPSDAASQVWEVQDNEGGAPFLYRDSVGWLIERVAADGTSKKFQAFVTEDFPPDGLAEGKIALKKGDDVIIVEDPEGNRVGENGIVVDRSWSPFKGIESGMVLVHFGDDDWKSTDYDPENTAWFYDSQVKVAANGKNPRVGARRKQAGMWRVSVEDSVYGGGLVYRIVEAPTAEEAKKLIQDKLVEDYGQFGPKVKGVRSMTEADEQLDSVWGSRKKASKYDNGFASGKRHWQHLDDRMFLNGLTQTPMTIFEPNGYRFGNRKQAELSGWADVAWLCNSPSGLGDEEDKHRVIFLGKRGKVVSMETIHFNGGYHAHTDQKVYTLNFGSRPGENADFFEDELTFHSLEGSRKQATVVHKDDGWYVESEKGKNLGGPYGSEGEAKKRLQQVEYFKHKGGKKVSSLWNKKAYDPVDPLDIIPGAPNAVGMYCDNGHNGPNYTFANPELVNLWTWWCLKHVPAEAVAAWRGGSPRYSMVFDDMLWGHNLKMRSAPCAVCGNPMENWPGIEVEGSRKQSFGDLEVGDEVILNDRRGIIKEIDEGFCLVDFGTIMNWCSWRDLVKVGDRKQASGYEVGDREYRYLVDKADGRGGFEITVGYFDDFEEAKAVAEKESIGSVEARVVEAVGIAEEKVVWSSKPYKYEGLEEYDDEEDEEYGYGPGPGYYDALYKDIDDTRERYSSRKEAIQFDLSADKFWRGYGMGQEAAKDGLYGDAYEAMSAGNYSVADGETEAGFVNGFQDACAGMINAEGSRKQAIQYGVYAGGELIITCNTREEAEAAQLDIQGDFPEMDVGIDVIPYSGFSDFNSPVADGELFKGADYMSGNVETLPGVNQTWRVYVGDIDTGYTVVEETPEDAITAWEGSKGYLEWGTTYGPVTVVPEWEAQANNWTADEERNPTAPGFLTKLVSPSERSKRALVKASDEFDDDDHVIVLKKKSEGLYDIMSMGKNIGTIKWDGMSIRVDWVAFADGHVFPVCPTEAHIEAAIQDYLDDRLVAGTLDQSFLVMLGSSKQAFDWSTDSGRCEFYDGLEAEDDDPAELDDYLNVDYGEPLYCPACNARCYGSDAMGSLGNKKWFRCRSCGMDFSIDME